MGVKLRAYGLSDIGMKRSSNQDAIYFDENQGLFIQADGMGGHQGGAVASALAIKGVTGVVESGIDEFRMNLLEREAIRGLSAEAKLVKTAIMAANSSVTMTGSGEDEELIGMGSTLDVLYLAGNRMVIGHVGDSRVYRFCDGTIELLTEDHSVLFELMKSQSLSPEEIASYPFRNRVTRALGYLADNDVDIIEDTVEPGDRFLLCSDGLTGVVADELIASIFIQEDDPATICKRLVSEANNAGGPDNISVVVVAVDDV